MKKLLVFVPTKDTDCEEFMQLLESSDFYGELNDGRIEFVEEAETVDELEAQLQKLVSLNNVGGHFHSEDLD